MIKTENQIWAFLVDKFNKVLKYRRAKKVIIDADDNFKICLDGEIYRGSHFEIENMRQILRFIKPKND